MGVSSFFSNLFGGNKNKEDAGLIADLNSQIESLKLKLSDAEKLASKTESEAKTATSDIKSHYEALLKEAEVHSQQLDKQLKDALQGKVDSSMLSQLAEVDKLKKKLKDLDEKIEESEDTINDLKKKIERKDKNIADLEDDLRSEQKSSKSLAEELKSVKDTLEEKMAELSIKMEALGFIQEILSAAEEDTEDIQKLNKAIDVFEGFVKDEYMDVNVPLYDNLLKWGDVGGKDGLALKKKYFGESFDQWASTKRKSWLDGKTTVAFVGEFSAGKTSIVNRILSQDDPSIPKLPVSAKATTAIPTYIAGGSSVSYSFISGDGKRKKILEETFKKVSKEVLDQVKGLSSLIKYFVMTYKNPNLAGLSILDTPGFNSNDQEDKERAIDVINECDALFWVFDVNAGTVNRSSISVLLQEKLKKPLYVVLNKVDTKAPSEVDKVESLIRSTLSDSGLQVEKYIRFSSEAPLSDIMEPIKNVNKTAIRGTFVSDVGEDIRQITEIIEGLVKDQDKAYNDSVKKGNNITDKFQKALDALGRDCDTAAGIPQWVEHLFSKDRYEMSAEQGQQLGNILDRICGQRVNDLANRYNERMNQAAETQQLYSDLVDLKNLFRRVDECASRYKQITKQLN